MPALPNAALSSREARDKNQRAAFIALITICGLFTLFLGQLYISSGDSTLRNVPRYLNTSAQGRDGLALIGHVYDINIPSRQVQISWDILGCGSFAEQDVDLRQCQCKMSRKAVEIHFDGSKAANISYDPNAGLLYRRDNPEAGSWRFNVGAAANVRTQHHLEVTGVGYGQDALNNYPFDAYNMATFIHSLDPITKLDLPMLFVRIVDATNGFVFQLTDAAQVRTKTFAVGNTANAFGVQYSFYRTPFSKIIVALTSILNWALAGMLIFIIASDYGNPKTIGDSHLILPVGVILIIPGVRALWIGAPAYGVLVDSFGTFPQVLVAAFASMYLCWNIITRRTHPSPS